MKKWKQRKLGKVKELAVTMAHTTLTNAISNRVGEEGEELVYMKTFEKIWIPIRFPIGNILIVTSLVEMFEEI